MRAFVNCGTCAAAQWVKVLPTEQEQGYAKCPVCKSEYDLGDQRHVAMVEFDKTEL